MNYDINSIKEDPSQIFTLIKREEYEIVEKLLTDNHIPYDLRDESWDNEEKIYHNIYDI